MLVLDDMKKLVLNLKNPERVLDAIPTAKRLTVGGVDITVVPHKLDEVKVLRNLGIAAPSPILHYYKYPGRFTPFDHQKQTSAFLTMHKKCLVLNQIGTGKSLSALWAADYLMSIGQVKKVLILSPLSTLERVWGDEIYKNFPGRTSVTLHGTAEKRRKLLSNNVDFYIINHDGFQIIAPQVKDMFDLIIVDEAAVMRNPQTTRFKVFRKFMSDNPNCRLWLMTGTPTPNEPTDAWALAKLVDSPALSETFTGFRDRVMMKVGQWKFLPRPNSHETVYKVLQPAICYSRDECLDLPDTVYQTRKVTMTKEQIDAYKAMMKHLIVEASAGQITAANEAVKAQKLVQIACGVAYDEMGGTIELDCTPRVSVVREIIEEAGGKVIVFVPLTGALHMLERELSKHFTVGVVNGEVSARKRNEIFQSFQHETDPQVLLAHPACMAHGLTLTSASTIVHYGPITSNEMYTQANGRIERIGKNKTSNVIHVEATELENRMYERLRNKQKLQGVLLEMIQGG